MNRVAIKDEFTRSELEAKPMADTKARNAHITVQHNYHDHSHDNRADYQEERPARGGVTTPFPLRLHDMLETVQADGFDHVLSWQPHGRCFVVHKPKEFVELLPQYFKLSKLASFQRQLNLYGFQRLTRGRDRGGYYHELFIKGKVFLAHSIQRIKVKGTGVRARSNPDQEPDFWAMPWVNNDLSSSSGCDQQQEPVLSCSSSSLTNHMVVDKSIAQLPLNLTPPVPKQKPFADELDCFENAFGEKTFHYLFRKTSKRFIMGTFRWLDYKY
jgi:hypothetical protein